ncbi:porin family protein [Bartonella krasnovii]|uniref:Porin family protein n=1 Tax=Bartonella krasnovii TaxID=2267275 RepID=A0ABY3W092_9HYPH|nr:outer membrane protein [Bartonella krasnovii]UNF29337.1 porin family protein [Bartonella krasnovii]UNF48881.1 porin family protein [Bartonella krasnovii]
MNIKSLVTTSVIAIATASAAQAADVIIPRETAPAVITAAPAYSWTGFYLGAQIGGRSMKTDKGSSTLGYHDLKLSGMLGGLYTGYNVDLGNGVIFGLDTDVSFIGKKDTINSLTKYVGGVLSKDLDTINQLLDDAKIERKDGLKVANGDEYVESITMKEKWSGATRVRIGFAADRIMPYIAGGVAYTQMQGITALEVKKDRLLPAKENGGKLIASGNVYDETKTLVGFTLGAGVDFAMTDNVLLRAEYRYSDYGKKKYFKDTAELQYKTNDFRVGVAYKF